MLFTCIYNMSLKLLNSLWQHASTPLAEVVPPDADITPGDASSEESPTGITAHCPIMLRDSISILMNSVCGNYDKKYWNCYKYWQRHSNHQDSSKHTNPPQIRNKGTPDVQQQVHCKWDTEQSGSFPLAALSSGPLASSPLGPPGDQSWLRPELDTEQRHYDLKS